MEEGIQINQKRRVGDYALESGVDELNLAEFPLAAISDRFLDGKKTVVFDDTVFCQEKKVYLPRRLTISGSDRYGLPTAKDDDVLLACIQISRLSDFASPEVNFSRYELLKLLRWADDARNYERVATSLRRWKGLTIYSDRAFYDHEQKSWVNRDFGIFDNLNIYRREVQQGKNAPGASRFVWNEVMYRSFLAGYMKRLDWGLYTSLESPVAKRLYRFLDKRFYYGNHLEIDLRELAVQKVRLSEQYNVAQMKRALLKGISELEDRWVLRRLEEGRRFVKQGKGSWKVVFERKPQRAQKPDSEGSTPMLVKSIEVSNPENTQNLRLELTKRGIGPATADELVNQHPPKSITDMIGLFDWYNQSGQSRQTGFLVNAIKNPENIGIPKGFQPPSQVQARKAAEKNRIAAEREFRTQREREHAQKEQARNNAFMTFWESLDPSEQERFETEALDAAEPTKRTGYLRSMGKGPNPVFEQYRSIILRDYFERRVPANSSRQSIS